MTDDVLDFPLRTEADVLNELDDARRLVRMQAGQLINQYYDHRVELARYQVSLCLVGFWCALTTLLVILERWGG